MIEKRAEAKLLGHLLKNPDSAFDVAAIIQEADFQYLSTRCIFAAIKRIVESRGGSLDKKERQVDKDILEQRIASDFPDIYKSNKKDFSSLINEIGNKEKLSIRDFKSTVDFVLKNSITKRAEKILNKTRKELGEQKSYKDILAHIESSIFDFTSSAIDGSDIVLLGENYKECLALRERLSGEGKLYIGISTGFPELDKAIGGGFRNGTVNLFAARAKMGKSFYGLKIADNVAQQGIPVLYMDTELEENYQSDRRCAQSMQIPINELETAKWIYSDSSRNKIDKFFNYQKKYPIYYVDIKGWSIDRQISVIRKFFAKYVGKTSDGKYNRGLVVLDYLKLMRAGEKGADKEWEALGYRMTLLHDLMAEYNNPMMALAQQNRDGLEKEDESTISGSDRIIWLCDNFSIISAISDSEVLAHQEEADEGKGSEHGHIKVKVPNTKLKVVVCRQGPGTPGAYISYYFDIKDRKLGYDKVCGYIEESGKRSTIVTDPGGAL